MKTILGLDLGVASIGWALIRDDDERKEILGLGSRIIPLSTDDKDEFSSGNAISKNQKRTQKRTQRKGYDRYQLRRKALTELLMKMGMFDPGLFNIPSLELWGLRNKAVYQKVNLPELGRIIFHLHQKRGYKSGRSEANLDKKDTEYVAEVKGRHSKINEENLTIGQYIYKGLTLDHESEEWKELCDKFGLSHQLPFRAKQQVFPREAYIEEFMKICSEQQRYYPEILTEDFISRLRDEVIYYQRRLKSQKGIVSVCEFEGKDRTTEDGKKRFTGPKVAPKTSPIFQVCKIWENINTITVKNRRGDDLRLTLEQKQLIFNHLDNNEKLTFSDLLKILKLNKNDGWYSNKQLERGLQGNVTKIIIKKCFSDPDEFVHLLNFDIQIEDIGEEANIVDRKTGEIHTNTKKIVTKEFEKEPFYRLWHLIYSIPDAEEEVLVRHLKEKYLLPEDIAIKLSRIDFKKQGFGNKSARAMRKILPYLMDGFVYSQACEFAGYNHSGSITKEENEERQLNDKLENLPKNSLRQPIVEKILNQMINLMNAVIDKYGKPDVIRVELARELKQSKDERNEAFRNIRQRERENKTIADRLENEYGIRATRKNIQKMRLFEELTEKEGRINAVCIYCGKQFGITQALKGTEVDIEHIIPQSLLFDDSLTNKTLSHRHCNADKGNMTAYDYMKTKSSGEFENYIDRVEQLAKDKIISWGKRNKLLMPVDKIPQDFIDRQIRETQYISKKSREILQQVCKEVWATSGSVTEYLRRVWGWDEVTMNLQMKKYKESALVDFIELKEIQDESGNVKMKEVIKGWSKRDDHRHHAIDALTIACTTQGIIQKMNKLNTLATRQEIRNELNVNYDKRKSLLENYVLDRKPFSTAEVEKIADRILISYKSGKKVATLSRRKVKGRVVQSGIIAPRGPLSEESVYGKIRILQKEVPLRKLFEQPDMIIKRKIKNKILQRLAENGNNPKKAFHSCRKDPVFLDDAKTVELTHATVYRDEYVLKYPVTGLKAKDIGAVVDYKLQKILSEHLAASGGNEKDAFKDIENKPIWFNKDKKIPVKTVRLKTGLSAVVPLVKDDKGEGIGFVKPGNNHHIAIYLDENGKYQEHVVTFWHAVERKKYRLPVIIKEPGKVWEEITESSNELPETFLSNLPLEHWQFIVSMQQNEMFLLSNDREMIQEALRQKDYPLLSKYLYRVQKLTDRDYFFRHHLETQLNDAEEMRQCERYYRISSFGAFFELNPMKVRLNYLGEITGQTDLNFS